MKQQRNVERLVARCESILSGKTTLVGQEWKLTKYVLALDQQIKELEKLPNIDPDLLKSYQQRASILREVLRNEEEPQALFSTSINSTGESLSFHSSPPSIHLPRYTSHSNELLMKANNKRISSMRNQLFAKTTVDEQEGGMTLKQRPRGERDDLESILRHHEQMQEEIAEDMIRMAQSLKNNSIAAKKIILSDNELLKKTTKQADSNIEAVETETTRLRKHNSGCGWGIWLLLLTVFIVFIAMVVFIRIVPKPR